MTRSTIVIGLFASLVGLCLSAQTLDLQATIPFEFRMGTSVMPAGAYDVHYSQHLLILRTASRSKSAAMLVLPAERREAKSVGTLVFNRYGNDYFLSQVWEAGSRAGSAIPPSKLEKELIARYGVVETASISARRK
jgi:hypothetical protein